MSIEPFLPIYFFVAAVYVLILLPFTIYHCYQLWKLRKETFFIKRFTKLSIIAILFGNYFAISRVVIHLPFLVPSIDYGYYQLYAHTSFADIPFSISLLRVWYSYFNYTRGLQLISKEWESKISNNNINKEYWTLKYTFLSNKSNLLYYIIIIYSIILEITSSTIFVYFRRDGRNKTAKFGTYIYYMTFAVICGIGIILAYKFRPCRDKLFIHGEGKRVGIQALISVFLLAVNFMFSDNEQMRYFCEIFIAFFFISYINFIMTKWVIDQYMKTLNKNTNKSQEIFIISLQEGLKNEDIFDLFAIHLVKEFSLENLLFLYESMKFKNQCLKHNLIDEEDIGIQLEFGKNSNSQHTPVTDIDSFYCNLKYIINRYIDSGAEYCVNVSSSIRNNIMTNILPYKQNKLIEHRHISNILATNIIKNNQDDKETIIKIVKMIDVAMKEIIQLLSGDSFRSFKQTDEFKQLYNK